MMAGLSPRETPFSENVHMLKKLVYVAVVLSFVLAASIASADTVSLAYQGVQNSAIVGIAGAYTGDVYAGNYTVTYSTDPTTSVSGYCVEPQTSSAPGAYQTYTLESIPDGSPFEAAAWVLSQHYEDQGKAPQAQVAVWELTWDGLGGANLTSGNFRLTNPNPSATPTPQFVTDALAIYNAALAGIAAGFDQSGYVLATNASYQNFVLTPPGGPPPPPPPPPPIPLPPSVFLLGSGLLGLGFLGWRRKRS